MTIASGSEIGETSVLKSALRELSQIDREVYGAIARQRTPTIDRPLSLLSRSANYSGIWIGAAAAISIFGGHSGRRAARRGLTAVVLTSVTVNVAGKSLYRRRRPVRDDESLADHRMVRMPESPSFPSGHSASAFRSLLLRAPPCRLLPLLCVSWRRQWRTHGSTPASTIRAT